MMRPTSTQREKHATKRASRPAKQPMNKMVKWLIAIGVVGALVVALIIAWPMIAAMLVPASIAPTAGYSIKVQDGVLAVDLDGDYFDYSLYGTNGSDWGDFELVETGDAISGIAAADLDLTDYEEYWALVNGTHPHDDDIFGDGEGDDIGDRVYGERWFKLDPSGPNVLTMYQTPDPVWMLAINSINGSVLNLTAGDLSVGTNVTILIGSNSTQTSAAYVPYYDPVSGENIQITVLITFDDLIVKGDFEIDGVSGSFVDTTNQDDLEFILGSMYAGTLTINGLWSGATIDGDATQADQIDLLWGSDVLATLA